MILARVALRNVQRNWRRTAAILLTVGLGSASLFIFHGFNAGIMDQYRENTIHSRYGHGQVNTAGYRERAFEKPWEHWITDYPRIEAGLRAIPAVKDVFPRVQFFALLTNGRVTVAGQGAGVMGPAEARFFHTLNVESGKQLTDEPDGVVLGLGLARALDVKPGDRVTALANTVNGSMNGADFTVTGIFHTGIKSYDDTAFRIPLSQAHQLLDTDRVESVTIGLDDIEQWDGVQKRISAQFPELEVAPFAVLDKIYYQNSVDWLNSQFAIIQSIILFIVVLGIFNTVSIGVLERKQEIGNLRANGESAADVMKLLSLEGIVLGCLGALLGIALAWVGNLVLLRHGFVMPPAPGITRQFHVMLSLRPEMAVKAFLLGAACSAFATVIAGVRVARMPIGESLRSI